MKAALIIILLLAFDNCIKAQLTVDAGSDKVQCGTWHGFDSTMLGGNPTASGGSGQYTYTWSADYLIDFSGTIYHLSASDLLTDTTAANPQLKYQLEQTTVFYLDVSDNNGNSVSDSVTVRYSLFSTHLAEYDYYILLGDSAGFFNTPNLSGDIQPITYLWGPSNTLSDPTLYSGIWASPTVNTSYYLTAIDSAGCEAVATPCFHVYVTGVGLNEKTENTAFSMHPNPCSDYVTLSFDEALKPRTIEIIDTQGQLVFQSTDVSNQIDVHHFDRGRYLVRVQDFNDRYFMQELLVK